MDKISVHYLQHSGFAVKLGKTLLVFDYYRDPADVVPKLLEKSEQVYFFSSHVHYDHFEPAIAGCQSQVDKYFLSYDIAADPGAKRIPADKAVYLEKYDAYKDERIMITTYSSTDAGVSFLIEIDGWKIFHAGDFNWWHWNGDTEENNKFARNGFIKQMKKLAGMKADVAFFPTDSRLEDAIEMGAKEFCRQCDIGYFIGMHAQNVEWQPSDTFFEAGREIPTWCPVTPGATKTIIK